MDDAHSTLVIRLSNVSTNADTFPASPDLLLDALRSGSAGLGQADEIRIPLSELGLQNSVCGNPVACANVFALLIDNVFNVLLGIPPATNNHHEYKKTKPVCSRKKGMFGTTTAAFGCVEVQARYKRKL